MTDCVPNLVVQGIDFRHLKFPWLVISALENFLHLGIFRRRRDQILCLRLLLLNGMSQIYQLPRNLSYETGNLIILGLPANHLLLAAVYGGVIQGVGIGLVFLGRGTTGGTDMMAALLQRKLRHYSIAQIMQFIDGAIVLVGMYVFGVQKALYAIIAVYLVTKVSDSMIEGLKFSKQAYIITSKPREISREIMDKLDRGVTGIHGKGMYSDQDKLLLYCVVGRKEIVTLKELVDDIDPDAFVIVSDVREVLGEGFIERR